MRSKGLYVTAFAVAAVVAVLARVRTIRYSLWHDETHNLIRFVQGGPGEIVASPRFELGNHIVTNLLTWLVATPLGYAEWVVRSPSVLAGLAALALLVWFSHRRGGRALALVVLVLSAVSAEQAELIPQARGYGIAYLTAVGLLVLAYALSQRFTTPRLAAYCATMFVAVYNYPALALLAVATTLLLVPLVRQRIQLLGAAAGTAVVVTAVYVHAVRVLYGSYDTGFDGDVDTIGWGDIAAVPVEKVSGLPILHFALTPWHVVLTLCATAALVAGVIVVVRQDRALALLLAGAPSLVLVLGWLTDAPMGPERYTSFLGPHLLLLAAVGIVGLWRRLLPRGLAEAANRRRVPALLGSLGLVAVFLVLTVPSAWRVAQEAALPYENFKQAIREVADVVEEEDDEVTVVVNSTRPTSFEFYAERDLPPDVDLRFGTGRDEACEQLRAAEPDRPIVLLDHTFYNEVVIPNLTHPGVVSTQPPQDRGRGWILVHRFPASAVVGPGQDGICG